MRGHIRRRGQKWAAVVSIGRDESGRPRYKWYSGFYTEKAAEEKLTAVLREMDTGTYIEPSHETVGSFLLRWLNDYARVSVAPRTFEGYEHIIRRHLVPALGGILLTKLTPARIQAYYSEKLTSGRLKKPPATKAAKAATRAVAPGLSARTVRHHHVTLHDALQSAVKWGLLGRNPADAVDPPKFQRPEMQTLDEEGVRKFLSVAESTRWYPIVYLALFTGLRRSELLALRSDYVDLDLGRLLVGGAEDRHQHLAGHVLHALDAG